MKYFLDTNIIIILFQGRFSELTDEVISILENKNNNFVASSISLNEIAQLYRKKKLKNFDYSEDKYKTANKLLKEVIRYFPISYLPFGVKHSLIASNLE